MATLKIIKNNLALLCEYEERTIAKEIKGHDWQKPLLAWLYPLSAKKIQEIKAKFNGIKVLPEVYGALNKTNSLSAELLKIKELKDFKIEVPIKTKPRAHQRVGIKFGLTANGFLLADQMGLGKTLQSLSIVILRKAANEVDRCLVVCPATVKSAWKKQIEEHTDKKFIIIEGDKKSRIKLYQDFRDNKDVLFLITNFASMRIDQEILQYLNFVTIIWDESYRIKNARAKQTKALKNIPAKYRIALSGHPLDRVEDLWSQFDFFLPGYLGSEWAFQDRYITKIPIIIKDHRASEREGKIKTREVKIITGYKNIAELKRRISPFFIRRLKKYTSDLPPKIFEIREVELKGEQKKAYESMQEDLRLWVKTMDRGEILVKASSILVQLTRLSQIAVGFITDETLKNPKWFKDPVKFSEIDVLLEELIASKEKVVLWSRFVPVTKALLKRYERYGSKAIYGDVPMKDRADIIDAFQEDNKTMVLCSQIATGGLGITLHRANTEIFSDVGMISGSQRNQAIDRLHRIGQKNTVTIIDIVAKNTIDAHWLEILKRKERIAQEILGDSDREKSVLDKNKILNLLK